LEIDGQLPGLQNGSSFFEARISSNDSALMVSAVIVETDGGEAGHNVTGVSVYSSQDGEPIAYSGSIDSQWSSGDKSASLVNAAPFPVSVPAGGIVGVTLGVSGLRDGDQVRVTFVYLAKPESATTTGTIPVARVDLNPLDITAVSTIAADPGIMVDGMFSDPETHCELCAKVVYNAEGSGEAAYVVKGMHLEGVSGVQFWARGEQGGEAWTFKAAGKRGPDGPVAYANATEIALGQEWTMHEIAIPANSTDLSSVTHLLAFEPSSGGIQTIYLKGMTYR
jgi:hypothetical protein